MAAPLYPAIRPAAPSVLNRPFRTVGELSYAYRDEPWKEVDFFTSTSADGAMLDLFCVNDAESNLGSALVAGAVNLNTRQAPVLQAILAGAVKDPNLSTTISNSDAQTVANAIVSWTGKCQPERALLKSQRLDHKGIHDLDGQCRVPYRINRSRFDASRLCARFPMSARRALGRL